MRAAVYHGPGDIRIESVPDARAPAADEILVEVTRAAICGTDSSEWAHGPLLARPPVVLGHEFTGRVVAAGDAVEGFIPGDRVVSGAGVSCGGCAWCASGRTNLCARYHTLGLHVDGGLAELVTTPALICEPVPEGLDDTAAAIAQPFAVALHAIRRGGLSAGESCAIIGVGGIGAFLVAGGAARDASPLIALDVDDDRLETASRLGATVTENASGRDIAELVLAATGGDGAHLVIEASGAPHAPAAALAAARRGGRVVLVGLQSAPRELDLLSVAVREVDLITTLAHVCAVDLPEALGLLARTSVAETVLDRTIGLAELVDSGIRPLAEGRARGKIVVDPRG